MTAIYYTKRAAQRLADECARRHPARTFTLEHGFYSAGDFRPQWVVKTEYEPGRFAYVDKPKRGFFKGVSHA